MIKLDFPSIDQSYFPDPDEHPECPSRLLVLVPGTIDHTAAVRRLRELVQITLMQVQLLGLCKDVTEEPELRRGLVTMTQLLQGNGISVATQVEIGTDWVGVVKNQYRKGDQIVCFAEQSTGLLRRPLREVLESNFKATVYIFSSLAPQKENTNSFSQIRPWLGFIGIIIGFGILQANIVRLPEGWFQTILLILSTIPEFWLIWFWNGRFG